MRSLVRAIQMADIEVVAEITSLKLVFVQTIGVLIEKSAELQKVSEVNFRRLCFRLIWSVDDR